MSQIILIALFIFISTARNTRRSDFSWSYDGDLTLVLDFANDFLEDDSRFVIFGSYAAHLASNGILPFDDIDIVQIQPSEEDPVDSQPLDLRNRTVVNYHGRVIDLKAGFVPSMDDLLDAVNINAVSVAFEFEKVGQDDIRLVANLKDATFDQFMQTRILQIVDPEVARANDCIRVLDKAKRYGLHYIFDGLSRYHCEKPQILNREKANMARPEIVGFEFSNQVFIVEGIPVWARSLAEAQAYFVHEMQNAAKQGGRRALWFWNSSSDEDYGVFSQGYYEQGEGKCVTDSGADPSHMYFHGIGQEQCRLKCDHEPACWGFSVSSWGNCLHWMQDDIKAGGASWGGAKCWIAQGVVENGRRSLSSAQNSESLVSQDRRLLGRSQPDYLNVGQGKCVTNSGEDPAHKYLHGVGEQTCRSECDADPECWGFSVSVYGNCLHWATDDLRESGGPSWGGAKCWIAQTLVASRSGDSVERGRRKN